MLTELPVDLFFHQLSYLPFRDVISVCSCNTTFHNYGLNPRFLTKWKALINKSYTDVDPSVLSDLHQWNYLVYTQLIHKLDPISQLMVYYRLSDGESLNDRRFTKEQRFLALFLLNKKELSEMLPSHHYQPFIDMLNGQPISQDILNKMAREFAMQGNMKGLLMMKDRGADIHDDYDRALQLACREGRLSVVKYLVEQGADVHTLDDYTPIILANQRGHLSVVKYLIEQGIDIHTENDQSLIVASKWGHLAIVKYLVEQGANIHIHNDQALIVAIERDYLTIVQYLVEHGADIHTLGNRGLKLASKYGQLITVQYLIEKGAIVDNKILHLAVKKGHLPIIRYLTENKLVKCELKDTLDLAIQMNHLEIIEYLVEQGASIHHPDDETLIHASARGHLELVKYFVEQNVDIHYKDEYALYLAFIYGNLETVKYLVEQGANICNMKDSVLLLSYQDYSTIIKYLTEHKPHLGGITDEDFLLEEYEKHIAIIDYLISQL